MQSKIRPATRIISSIPGLFVLGFGLYLWHSLAVGHLPTFGFLLSLLFWPAGLIWTLAAAFGKPKQ